MANPLKGVPENVPGEFFVDRTCIDCDACRQIAPAVFGEGAETSFVKHQPADPMERRSALHALLSCPTGSIGCLNAKETQGKHSLGVPVADFPLLLEEPVYYCGFNSPKSYGGNSYFLRHPDGNWLVDSPKFVNPLVRQFEKLGGISRIFLTHRDDVADAAKYARHFGAKRIIHRLELASQPDAEIVLDGTEPVEVAPSFLVIPTPGHTSGHCCLLCGERFLFTGDHLDWDRDRGQLAASENYCWHSWPQQVDSIRRLAEFPFEWVLPGHGQRVKLPGERMRHEVLALAYRCGNAISDSKGET